MIIACNKSDRHDLQIIQNDALHTCYNVKRRDKFSITLEYPSGILVELNVNNSTLRNIMFVNIRTVRSIKGPTYGNCCLLTLLRLILYINLRPY